MLRKTAFVILCAGKYRNELQQWKNAEVIAFDYSTCSRFDQYSLTRVAAPIKKNCLCRNRALHLHYRSRKNYNFSFKFLVRLFLCILRRQDLIFSIKNKYLSSKKSVC